jgi:MinD-like ATPase involved in chromosome partitioning or flagellar assembly
VTDRDDFAQEHLAPPPDEQPPPPQEQLSPPEDRPEQWSGPVPEQRGGQHAQQPQPHGYPAPPPQSQQPWPLPSGWTRYRDETQEFAAPGIDPQHRWQQPPPSREPSAATPRQGGQWPSGPDQSERRVTAPPTGWNYVEGIRTSELVPTRTVPPGRGWRRLVYNATFGAVNLGQSPDELRQAHLEAKIRTLLRGRYKIGVLGKGGVGRTTVAACVGSIFAQLRQDDRVVAIDADTSFGKLGARVDPHATGSYWDLAADEHLDTFADVRTRVGNNADGLFVLAGEAATAQRRVLDPAIYREAASRLDRHFTISIVDCGSTLDSPVTQEVLRDVDALIVVSSPWIDGASAAGQTLEWLDNHGMANLLHRTVVVLNDSDGHADRRTRMILAQQFVDHGQVVIEVPFDPHLRPGGVIDITNEMSPKTRRSFYEIAAAIGEHFAQTHAPRDQRLQ